MRIVATGLDTAPFMAVLQIAYDKGWFKDEHLNVTLDSGSGGGSTIAPVITGDADLTIGSPAASVLAAQKEPTLRIVGPWFQANDFVWVSTTAVSGASDLKDKTIAFSTAGSTSEAVAKAVAAKTGAKPTQVGSPAATWVAAKSGKVFAAWGTHPLVTTWQKEGGHVVAKGADYLPHFETDLVLVNADYAKQHAEGIRAFWRVIDKSFKWILEKPQEAAPEIAKIMKLDTADVLQGLKDTPDAQRGYSIKVDPEALKTVSDIMIANGQIKDSVDWKKIFDQQYLPAADRATI